MAPVGDDFSLLLLLPVSPDGVALPMPDTVWYTVVIGTPSAPVVLRRRKVASEYNRESVHQARDIRDSGLVSCAL